MQYFNSADYREWLVFGVTDLYFARIQIVVVQIVWYTLVVRVGTHAHWGSSWSRLV
jgi:hypothetical protein